MIDPAAYPLPLQKMHAREYVLCVVLALVSGIVAFALAAAAFVGG